MLRFAWLQQAREKRLLLFFMYPRRIPPGFTEAYSLEEMHTIL